MSNIYEQLMAKHHDDELTLDELACAIYEGTPHLQNLAEKLARQHGKAGALSFYDLMGENIQNFYKTIAKQLIDHAKRWEENQGSGCCLDAVEMARLKTLERVK